MRTIKYNHTNARSGRVLASSGGWLLWTALMNSTFKDKVNDDDILQQLDEIATELEKDLTNLQYAGRTVTVKFKHHTYESGSSVGFADSQARHAHTL